MSFDAFKYTPEVEEKILLELDKWNIIKDPDSSVVVKDVDGELLDLRKGENNSISSVELEGLWYSSVDEALLMIHRTSLTGYNIVQQRLFQRGLIILTASNAWAKYNTRITKTNEEEIIIDGHAGRLRKRAESIIRPFTRLLGIGLNRVCRDQEERDPFQPTRPWHRNYKMYIKAHDGCLYSLYELEEDRNHIRADLRNNGSDLVISSDFISDCYIRNGDLILVKKES